MEALNLHKRYIHDSSKLHWFKCQICGKSDFLLLSDLYTHRVESHPEIEWKGEREKPFGCGICERPFLRKGDALVCAVLGHEPGGIYEVMFQWKCGECPEDRLGYWRVEELREHWERVHNDKEVPEEVMMSNGGDGGGQLPCVQIDKREAYDLKENWEGEETPKLILEFDLLGMEDKRKKGLSRRGCEIPVFGCPDCLLTFVDVESLRIHEKVHLRDEGPPMPSPVRKRGRPSSKSGGGKVEVVGGGSAGVLEMGSPDKHQEPISLVGENGVGVGGVRGKHLIPKYDCQVCGKKFRKLKRLREHEQFHKLEDPNCKVFPKVMGRGGRKKGSGGGGVGAGKTAMQRKIAHAGGILRKRGRPKKVRVKEMQSPRKGEGEEDEEEVGEEKEGMEWWEEALMDEEEEDEEMMEKDFKCGSCEAAFHLAKQLRMHELAAHNAPHRKPGRKPRVMVNGEERLVEKQVLKKKKKILKEEKGGEEEKPLRPGRIKVGRLEISTRLNREIRESAPIKIIKEKEDGRKVVQYRCPKCTKEFRDKRGIHLHILGHSLKGKPGEKQRKLDEGEEDEEFEGEGERSSPGEIGERRMSDRERKVPRKLSDFEVEDGEEEDERGMEVEMEGMVVDAPVAKVTEGTQVKVTEEKKRMPFPKELYGEVVKNMSILQAEGRIEEKKEATVVTASAASSAFEKISGQIVGMKKDKLMKKKKKTKVVKPVASGVESGVKGGEGEGPPVPDYYGEGEGGGGCDKVTCQTCLKTFDSVEHLWYHCSQEHFNKGGKVKYIPKAVAPVVPVSVSEVDTSVGEGECPKKELKTYGSAKKIAFLSLLEKRREEQCPSPPKVAAPTLKKEETTQKVQVPAAPATVNEEPPVVPVPTQVPVTATTSVASNQATAKTASTSSRPPPPGLIPLNAITGRDNSGAPQTPSTSQQKTKSEAVLLPVPVQAAHIEDKIKASSSPPIENVNKVTTEPAKTSISIEAKVNNKQERRISIETPKKPEANVKLSVTTNLAETVKVTPPKQVLKKTKTPPPPAEVKTPKVIQSIVRNAVPEVKTPKVVPPPIVKSTPPPPPQPETVKPQSPSKPEVTKTFTIKSNPDLSISIVKTRPTQQVFTSSAPSTSTSTSTSTPEPKPEVSISLVKARQQQMQQQQQHLMSKPPSQLSVSLVKSKVIQVPIPPQFPKTVPTYKLSELIKCASKKYPLPPNLPKLSQQSGPQFIKRPPPLTPAPGARSPPKPVASMVSLQQSAVPAPPKLEGIKKKKIILVSKSFVGSSHPPKKLEETLKASPSVKPGHAVALVTKLEETLKKKAEDEVIVPISLRQIISSKLEGGPLKKNIEIQKDPPKKEETTQKNQVPIASPPKMEEPLKKVTVSIPAAKLPPKQEDILKKKDISTSSLPATPKPLPKLEETLKKKDNPQASPSAPPKLKETLKRKLEHAQVPPKLEDTQKKPENKAVSLQVKPATISAPPKLEEIKPAKAVPPILEKTKKPESKVVEPTKPTPSSVPSKLEEPSSVQKDKPEEASEQPVSPAPPKLEETENKRESKKSPPATKPTPLSVPPKLEEPSSVENKIEKPKVASEQPVNPAPPKLEEPKKKPESKKSSPATKPGTPSIPPKLEELVKTTEKVTASPPLNPAPPKVEETPTDCEPSPPPVPPKPVEEPPKVKEESPDQSAVSSSSARVVASAPLLKSTSSTENPMTPPPLSSPTANEFRFKIIKQSVILPFKKRPGRPSPKYLEYLEGKQKSSSKSKALVGTSKKLASLNPLAAQSPAAKDSSKTTPKPGIATETQPIKIEETFSPATGSTPSTSSTVTSDPPIKRKRGRPWPPKTPNPTTTPIQTSTPNSNGTIKRKRGRPWPPKVPPTTSSSPPNPTTPQRAIIKPSPYSPDIITSSSSSSASKRKMSPAPPQTPDTADTSLPPIEELPSLEQEPPLKKPKRKPGRPRIHPPKDPNRPKGKRGRPRTVVPEGETCSPNGDAEESMEDSSILSSSAADDTLGTEGEGTEGRTPEVKRKRGRPFKKRRGGLPSKSTVGPNQAEEAVAALATRHSIATSSVASPGGEVQKRGRGRPRRSMPILTPAVD